jgi:hypothetical protein
MCIQIEKELLARQWSVESVLIQGRRLSLLPTTALATILVKKPRFCPSSTEELLLAKRMRYIAGVMLQGFKVV